jgi:hypothetical protein
LIRLTIASQYGAALQRLENAIARGQSGHEDALRKRSG